MAKGLVGEVTGAVTAAPKKALGFAKESTAAFILVVIVAGILFLRYSAKIGEKAKAGIAEGSKFWKAVGWVSGVSALALFVAIAMHGPAVAANLNPSDVAPFGIGLGLVVKGFQKGPTFTHLWTSGAQAESMPLGDVLGERSMVLKYPYEAIDGKPIKATHIRIRIAGTYTGSEALTQILYASEFGRMLSYAELDSPTLGTFDRSVLTGPNLHSFFTPLLNRGRFGGFCRPSLPAGALATPFTFSVSIPFIDTNSRRPIDTARLIRELEGSVLRVNMAAANVFASVVTNGGTISGVTCSVTTETVVDHGKDAWELGSVLVFTRYLQKAAAGSDEITFVDFGKANGPAATSKANGSRIVAAGLVSSGAGLGGPVANFANVRRYGCPQLYQGETQLVNNYTEAMIESLNLQNPLGVENDPQNWDWPLTVNPVVPDGLTPIMSRLLFFPIILSSEAVGNQQQARMGGNLKVSITMDSPPDDGQWVLLAIEKRDLQGRVISGVARSLGKSDVDRSTDDGEPGSKTDTMAEQGVPIKLA